MPVDDATAALVELALITLEHGVVRAGPEQLPVGCDVPRDRLHDAAVGEPELAGAVELPVDPATPGRGVAPEAENTPPMTIRPFQSAAA
jgi:hypothetical protein